MSFLSRNISRTAIAARLILGFAKLLLSTGILPCVPRLKNAKSSCSVVLSHHQLNSILLRYEYRNKIEFSWWWDKTTEQLDLAFFRRGTHGKIPVESSSLANPNINRAAIAVRDTVSYTHLRA